MMSLSIILPGIDNDTRLLLNLMHSSILLASLIMIPKATRSYLVPKCVSKSFLCTKMLGAVGYGKAGQIPKVFEEERNVEM